MALTESTNIDKIEVLENGIIQVRRAIRVFRDGEEIALSYHRWTLIPGADISAEDSRVQAVCNAVWI